MVPLVQFMGGLGLSNKFGLNPSACDICGDAGSVPACELYPQRTGGSGGSGIYRRMYDSTGICKIVLSAFEADDIYSART